VSDKQKSPHCSKVHVAQRCLNTFSESPAGTLWQEHFETQGFYTWNVTVAGKKIVAKIAPEDVQKFANWDTSLIWDQFPSATDVLTLHGLEDKTVPPWVISRYLNRKKKRKEKITLIYFQILVTMR
jgi:hypothetical protein